MTTKDTFTMSNPIRDEFRVSNSATFEPQVKKRRKQIRAPRSVTSIKPNPEVWKVALSLRKSPGQIIEIVSETECVVHNGYGARSWKNRQTIGRGR